MALPQVPWGREAAGAGVPTRLPSWDCHPLGTGLLPADMRRQVSVHRLPAHRRGPGHGGIRAGARGPSPLRLTSCTGDGCCGSPLATASLGPVVAKAPAGQHWERLSHRGLGLAVHHGEGPAASSEPDPVRWSSAPEAGSQAPHPQGAPSLPGPLGPCCPWGERNHCSWRKMQR